MNKFIYIKLAINNIKKNKSTFFPFALSCGTMIALFYILFSINNQAAEAIFFGGATMSSVLGLGLWVCGIFSALVIFYTNGFLLKRRNKELGLYSVLGMEKKHIGRILFWEIIFIGGISLLGGLLGGMLFSKLMFLGLLNLMELNPTFDFSISLNGIILTLIIFSSIFLVIILYNNLKLKKLNPIELLQESKAGEREPKAKWISAILGAICLSIGYYLAVTTENPFDAMNVFFIAVLFVIAGTYLLFMSGSIALLKILKNNKKYYYHKTHFITVSGMMYRMKQNAAGLANICILSTAVLVVLSSTVSLYIGIEDVNEANIPHVSTVEDIFTSRQDALSIYGSLFFIGIFIGTLFLLTTVLIIYYKQISEGYEDRNRFIIMQNVGMSKGEVKKVIKDQILTIFYLPICLAVVHIVFAFDIIRKILAVLYLTNVKLFIGCTFGTIFVFTVIYGIVYRLTAKAYYKIVNPAVS